MNEFLMFLFSTETVIYILAINALVFIIKKYLKIYVSEKITKPVLIILPTIISLILTIFITNTAGVHWFLLGLGMGVICNLVYDVIRSFIKKFNTDANK